MPSGEKFVLCSPRFYGVEYVINPWMEGNIGRANRDVALRQWDALRRALAARGHIEVIEPVAGLPDNLLASRLGSDAPRREAPRDHQ